MTIKTFSPLQSTTTEYYVNSSTYNGAELMFDDSNSNLNLLIFRQDFDNPTRHYVLSYNSLNGYYNGSGYDYRIDFSNYIKIVHSNAFIPTTASYLKALVNIPPNQCNITIYIGTNDILTDLEPYLTTLGNGEKYLTTFPGISLPGVLLHDNFVFYDQGKQSLYTSELYTNSDFMVLLDNTASTYVIDYVRFYDSSNTLITGNGTETDIAYNPNYIKMNLFMVPDGAYKVEVGFRISGTLDTITKYVKGCAINQYFYYGTTHMVEALYCTGKREKIENVTKEYLKYSSKNNAIRIKKQTTYQQNVGFSLTESQVFDLSTTPFLVEYTSTHPNEATTVLWNLNNETFEGYNTKRLSEKNFVLNLTKQNEQIRYTSPNINFYS